MEPKIFHLPPTPLIDYPYPKENMASHFFFILVLFGGGLGGGPVGKTLYIVYQVHHEWTAPFAIAALYAHPVEHLLTGQVSS